MSNRVNLAIGDTYHQILKLLAVTRGITLTELVEEIMLAGIRKEFDRDPVLETLVRQLVVRDESSVKEKDKEGNTLRDRTLALLDLIQAQGKAHTKAKSKEKE